MTNNHDPIKELISRYKDYKHRNGHSDEFYKYEAIQHFQENWKIDADDFSSMLKNALSKQTNLMYNLAYGTILKLAEKYPKEIRELFRFLFDENVELEERIKRFDKETDKLFKTLDSDRNGFQDERSVSDYLTFRYPENYTFYKDSYYSKACKLINEKKARKGKKYVHYLDLIKELKEKYLEDDDELWQLTNAKLPENVWKDKNLNILAQDILYVTLDQNLLNNYWVFQCNPNQYDIFTEWQNLEEETWSVSAHKKEIKSGDKVILWVTGEKSGCYGLCTVTSEVLNDDGEFVELDIDYNLVNAPILKEKLLNLPEFVNFKGGNQGTNLSATKEQYEKILEMIKSKVSYSDEEIRLISVIRKIQNKEKVEFHFKLVDHLIKTLNLKSSEKRIVFSTANKSNYLAVTINQRYVLHSTPNFYGFIIPSDVRQKFEKTNNVQEIGNYKSLPAESDTPI